MVDIDGNLVTVNSFRGNTGDYEIFDTFTINQPSIVPGLSEWSTAICAIVVLMIGFALMRKRVKTES